jgi:hypothetical protein
VSKNAGGSSIVHNDDTKESISISVKKGDDELATVPTVNFIKIDVEGYEYEVLLGMKQHITKDKPTLCIEFSGQFYKDQGKNHGKKILSFLMDQGYILYDIEQDMKKITNIEEFLSYFPQSMTQTNLLCVHPRTNQQQ